MIFRLFHQKYIQCKYIINFWRDFQCLSHRNWNRKFSAYVWGSKDPFYVFVSFFFFHFVNVSIFEAFGMGLFSTFPNICYGRKLKSQNEENQLDPNEAVPFVWKCMYNIHVMCTFVIHTACRLSVFYPNVSISIFQSIKLKFQTTTFHFNFVAHFRLRFLSGDAFTFEGWKAKGEGKNGKTILYLLVLDSWNS